jgi:hypothetical protein
METPSIRNGGWTARADKPISVTLNFSARLVARRTGVVNVKPSGGYADKPDRHSKKLPIADDRPLPTGYLISLATGYLIDVI